MYPHDYHLHSNFSCDCKASLVEQCISAIQKGLPEIGITDHFDLHPGDECRGFFRPGEWAAEFEQARQEFEGRLVVRAGIELGEPHLYRAECQALLQSYPFDYALGSLHWVGDEVVFDRRYFRRPADEAYGLFFEELECMTRAGGFDVLSHFDVVARVGAPLYGGYDPRRHAEVIRAVLKNCIDHGIALDLNTQGLRNRCQLLTPGVEILRWFREMGGERVTLGSDAHTPDDIAANFDAALDALRAAGLNTVTQFERRQAKLVKIAE
jgi:histidinol-phosphatase (PHP family)